MPIIQLETHIHAPIDRCFDLARSIDLHKISTAHTKEEAVAGTTSGLIGLGESVAWRAKHLGVYQKLTTKITAFEAPTFFVDEMTKGAFKHFRHAHHFRSENGITIMLDMFDFSSPAGILGKLFNQLFLTQYMTQLLEKRNAVVKEFAESERWREVLE